MTTKSVFEGDLLPCPFCGGAPVKFFDDGAQLDGTCACSDVGCSDFGCPGAALLAVTYKQWNTRAELVPDEVLNSKYAISMGDDYARGYRRGYDAVKDICDHLGIRPQDQNEQTARMAIKKLKAEIIYLEADARKLRGLLGEKPENGNGDPVAIVQVSQVDGWASAYMPRYSGRHIGVRFPLDTSSLYDGQPLYADPDRPKIKLQCNVSNVRITVNEDGSYTIDPGDQPAPVAVVMPEQLIAAIEAEQERLSQEGYLMDSDECVKVIREEVARLNGVNP